MRIEPVFLFDLDGTLVRAKDQYDAVVPSQILGNTVVVRR
jgi:trehalose-6-phosphatase